MTTVTLIHFTTASNVLARNFTVLQPDIVYCADITYIWTSESWLYLAIVIDLYYRKVVSWSLGNRMTKMLVISALQMAI